MRNEAVELLQHLDHPVDTALQITIHPEARVKIWTTITVPIGYAMHVEMMHIVSAEVDKP